ncbi:unnamed protein product [Agarophyton chilense]
MPASSAFVTSFSSFRSGRDSKVSTNALSTNALSTSAFCPKVRRARHVRTHTTIRASAPVEVDETTFDEQVIKQSDTTPVLVDFYAEWCGPCKLVAPLMDWAASEFDGDLKVVKVDTDKNDRFVSEYAIRGLPTFAVFKKGNVYGLREGAMGKEELERYIVEYMKIDE